MTPHPLGPMRRADRILIVLHQVVIAALVLLMLLCLAGRSAAAEQRDHTDARLDAIEARLAVLETLRVDARLSVLETVRDDLKETRTMIYGIVGSVIAHMVLTIIQIRGQRNRRQHGS